MYYAFQRECQNAAVLQMIQTAVAKTRKTEGDGGAAPVLLLAKPRSQQQAWKGLVGFADDVRETRSVPPNMSEEHFVRIENSEQVPRFTKCFGWLRLDLAAAKRQMPYSVRPYPHTSGKDRRSFDTEEKPHRFAIVYEYIEEGPNDLDKVARADRFLYQAGFCAVITQLSCNWRSTILVDHSDFVLPFQVGWEVRFYSRCRGKVGMLRESEFDARKRLARERKEKEEAAEKQAS